jgi:hypothetical protein
MLEVRRKWQKSVQWVNVRDHVTLVIYGWKSNSRAGPWCYYSLPNPYPRFPTWITRRTANPFFFCLFVLMVPQFICPWKGSWLRTMLQNGQSFPVMSVEVMVFSETKHQTQDRNTGHEPRGQASNIWDSSRFFLTSQGLTARKEKCKMSAQPQ